MNRGITVFHDETGAMIYPNGYKARSNHVTGFLTIFGQDSEGNDYEIAEHSRWDHWWLIGEEVDDPEVTDEEE
jgi:hypothetical protein